MPEEINQIAIDKAKAEKVPEPASIKFNLKDGDESEIELEGQEQLLPFYTDRVHFIAPFFIIDVETNRVMSLKLSLESLIQNSSSLINCFSTLISRKNTKKVML